MELQKDFREFIASFLSHKVEFLLVGGYALAFYGAPRFTEDIDFFVRISPENAKQMEAALASFGFQSVGITQADFLEPEQVIQLGRPPHRIDLLTSITAVSWDEAWRERQEVDLGGLKVWVIGRKHLIVNKRASGRLQDMADVARLEQITSPKAPKA